MNKNPKFLAFLKAISQRDDERLNDLIHQEANFEFPYELSKENKSLRERKAIINYLLDKRIRRTFSEVRIIEQSIEGYTIAEIQAEEYYPLIGKSLFQDVICFLSFYEGKIKTYKEYFNPIIRLEGLLNLDNSELKNFE